MEKFAIIASATVNNMDFKALVSYSSVFIN